jgi:rfaE bifunctional protein nucleotidyltransferase chain/domain
MKPRKLLNKIKSQDALKRILAKVRAQETPQGRSPRVVFTNGCFDILHKGHVAYLENARAQGDILVVAVNSDKSVRRLKGSDRPINPLADRLEVMAALEAADYVTWFEQDTPLEIIVKLKPDILVKGGDWSIDQMVGGREVLSWGGKVRSLNFVKGRSSTQIIERAGITRKRKKP